MMRRNTLGLFAQSLLVLGSACQSPDDEAGDGEHDSIAIGKGDGSIDPDSFEAKAVLLAVNDREVSMTELDIDAALDKRAAENIIAHRDGDDDLFDDLEELDELSFVGQKAFDALLKYAIAEGYLDRVKGDPDLAAITDVVFSPQPSEQSHNARVASMIDEARETIDIGMY